MTGRWICKKCGLEMKKALLPSYEHEPGIIMTNVEAFQCPNCREFVFDEKQVLKIERRMEAIKAHAFSFERKFTVSGRSLVVNMPQDLVRHMNLRKGLKAKLFPVDDKRVLIEVA